MSEGRKDDSEKVRIDLFPPEALFAISTILTFGAKKYDDRNWEKGMKWGRVFGAMMRHMWAWWGGKGPTTKSFLFGVLDEETSHSHLWHAGCCLVFLIAYEERSVGEDDRLNDPGRGHNEHGHPIDMKNDPGRDDQLDQMEWMGYPMISTSKWKLSTRTSLDGYEYPVLRRDLQFNKEIYGDRENPYMEIFGQRDDIFNGLVNYGHFSSESFDGPLEPTDRLPWSFAEFCDKHGSTSRSTWDKYLYAWNAYANRWEDAHK